MPWFRVNKPDVVFEVFDEEIVLVNLESGNYFSLSGTAPRIWMDIAEGHSIDDVVHRLGSVFDTPEGDIRASVREFVADLVAKDLLVPTDGDRGETPANSALNGTAKSTQPFSKPVIEAYSDMQDLLILDPIHDVDEAGWPVAKTGA